MAATAAGDTSGVVSLKTFQNYIAGQWTDAASGATFENVNPSRTSEVLGGFPRSGATDVAAAVAAAKAAFLEWRGVPGPERGEVMLKAARLMEERKAELAQVISRENGKTHKSALGDVQSGIDMAYYSAGEGRRSFGRTSQSGLRRRFAMTKRYPIGVVAVITSWNMPWAITCWKTLPTLMAGNTVVLKSEENTPESAVHFAQIMAEAGVPPGVLNVVHGYGVEAGLALTEHADISAVTFTGSSGTGRSVGSTVVGRLRKVSLELGGKNAVVVMEDADVDLAVDGVVCGAFSLSGQRCTATSRAIVHESVYERFTSGLLERTAEYRVGPGYDQTSDVTPLISRRQLDRVLRYVESARANGARVLCGGEQLVGGVYDEGSYLAPTILENVTADAQIAREEVFGPVLVLFKASSYADAMRTHNAVPYGLSASLFTRDVNRAFAFFEDAEAGVCYINAPTFGGEPHMPFGGVKDSGLGYRESGWAIFEAMTEERTLYIDYSGGIQNVQFVED
jgi:alpha-ketoglutaric semialdehyde dehydrogenase